MLKSVVASIRAICTKSKSKDSDNDDKSMRHSFYMQEVAHHNHSTSSRFSLQNTSARLSVKDLFFKVQESFTQYDNEENAADTHNNGSDEENQETSQVFKLVRNRYSSLPLHPTYFFDTNEVGNVEHTIAYFMRWSFQTSFVRLVGVFIIFYLFQCIFFGIILFIESKIYPKCIYTSGEGENTTRIQDTFSLSWATFSTVGYGVVYPNTSAEENRYERCAVTTATVCLEAFIGILYAGFCGAVLFTKTLKNQRVAQVTFSDPLCISYGSGAESRSTIDQFSRNQDAAEIGDDDQRINCPILEFRLVNKMSNSIGGTIIDATVKCTMQISPLYNRARLGGNGFTTVDVDEDVSSDSEPKLSKTGTVPNRCALTRSKGKRRLRRWSESSEGLSRSIASPFTNRMPSRRRNSAKSTHLPEIALVGNESVEIKTRFVNVSIEQPLHPYFERVWVVRHKLDEHSPLLKRDMRNRIKQNKGFWPGPFNNYDDIRFSLVNFKSLVLSVTGTDQDSEENVVARHVYDPSHIIIGYRFAEAVRVKPDNIFVDFSYINCVRKQNGELAEPIRPN